MKTNIRLKIILLLAASPVMISTSFAQLSGSYTVGDTTCDYLYISDAIDDVAAKGVKGSVVFNIRPGKYPEFTIGAMPKLAYPDSIIIQSETHDSTDVVISGTVRLNDASGITLRWLTLENRGTKTNIALQSLRSYRINVLNCLVSTPNSNGTIDYEHCAFDIGHNSDFPRSSIRIINCLLTGKGGGFNIRGYKGTTHIMNCSMSSTGRYSITANSIENFYVLNCILPGTISVRDAPGSIMKGCTIKGPNIDITEFNLIEGNDFTRTEGSDVMEVAGLELRNNRFRHSATVRAEIAELNVFDSDAEVARCNSVKFINNRVYGELKFVFSNNVHLSRNIVHGKARLSFADNCLVDNNIFYGVFTNAISSNNKFYYNNFAGAAILTSQMMDIEAFYNNFSQECLVTLQSKIRYNNYFPQGGLWDQHPYHYDPQYLNDSNARASNPMLMGKGGAVASVTRDIDGFTRPKKPTIGASEICIPSFVGLGTASLVCGDGISLRRCDADKLTGYRWYPSTGLSDTLSASPNARPLLNTMYYLADSTGAISDSIWVHVKAYQPDGLDTFDLPSCGGSIMVGKNFHPTATYSWSPSAGLSHTKIFNPYATLEKDILYIQNISIPGCGAYADSVFVNVDQVPIASAYPAVNKFQVVFYNNSTCSDSFLWDFGDGQKSKEETPVHDYDSAGSYACSLTAANASFSNTVYFNVQIYPVGIDNSGMQLQGVRVYPNPSSGLIHIELKSSGVNSTLSVFNSLGQLIHSGPLDTLENQDYTLPEIQGVYIVQVLGADGDLYTVKVLRR